VEVIDRYGLPLDLFEELIEARHLDLGGELLGSLDQVELYAKHTSANLIDLAARILGAPAGGIAAPAGASMTIVSLLRMFALDAARGRLFIPTDMLVRHAVLPQDILAGQSSDGLIAALSSLRELAAQRYEEARAATSETAPTVIAAWLPVALMPLYLRALQRGEQEPFRPVEVPQWRRQWVLWRTARTGRLPQL
jgi:phytoene synthase